MLSYFINGFGSFVDKNKVKIKSSDEEIVIESKNIIIATGSKPASLPFVKIDKERIISSTEALKLPEVPKHLVIIGGGVIANCKGMVIGKASAGIEVTNADALIISTEWSIFRTPDFNTIKEKLNNAVIFDGRNLYDLARPN